VVAGPDEVESAAAACWTLTTGLKE
jgi:hypothetical protein